MIHITLEAVEEELCKVKECPMTSRNLELYVLLSKAKSCLEKEAYHSGFTKEDADAWVKHMTPPAKWTMEQTTTFMRQRNYNHDPCEFFAVMNALASDYGKTMAKYNADKPEVWADLAHDFIEDADAADGKVWRYYTGIVKH